MQHLSVNLNDGSFWWPWNGSDFCPGHHRLWWFFKQPLLLMVFQATFSFNGCPPSVQRWNSYLPSSKSIRQSAQTSQDAYVHGSFRDYDDKLLGGLPRWLWCFPVEGARSWRHCRHCFQESRMLTQVSCNVKQKSVKVQDLFSPF